MKLIEGADDGGYGTRRYGGITGCGIDSAVAQKHLNGAGVGSVLKQMRGKAVAQNVRGHAFFDACHAAGVAADLLYCAGLDMSPGMCAGEKIICRLLDFPVLSKQI